tara:strand:+ start:1129 stop:1527 length:399 start_codon:yes stop_codon:yes gene_type:complete
MKYKKNELKIILLEVKTIAIVGASANPERDSYKVMNYLITKGYKVFPVNPYETKILGRKCHQSLKTIKDKVDMIDVFRAKEYLLDITREAIEIEAHILWTQEGIIDEKASALARSSGMKVIMNQCPKKVLEA